MPTATNTWKCIPDGRRSTALVGGIRNERFENHPDWELEGTEEPVELEEGEEGPVVVNQLAGGWYELVVDGGVAERVQGKDKAAARAAVLASVLPAPDAETDDAETDDAETDAGGGDAGDDDGGGE